MVEKGYTPIDQIADKYEQMNPKFNDGKYGSLFMWGLGTDYAQADMLGEDKIHMTMVPQFSDKRYIFTDSWSYVLNTASQNKEAAIKFLQYMASEEGMKANYEAFDRYPARKDGEGGSGYRSCKGDLFQICKRMCRKRTSDAAADYGIYFCNGNDLPVLCEG